MQKCHEESFDSLFLELDFQQETKMNKLFQRNSFEKLYIPMLITLFGFSSMIIFSLFRFFMALHSNHGYSFMMIFIIFESSNDYYSPNHR